MPRVVEGRVYKDLRQVSTVPHLHCHLSNRRQLPTPRNSAMSYIPSNGRYVRTRDGQSEIWATTENGRVTLHPATTRPVRPASSSSEQPFETRTPSPTARRLPLGIRDGAPGSSSSVEEMRPDGRFPSPRTQPSRGGPPFANRPQVNPAYPHGPTHGILAPLLPSKSRRFAKSIPVSSAHRRAATPRFSLFGRQRTSRDAFPEFSSGLPPNHRYLG
jgi:hypothetical protein